MTTSDETTPTLQGFFHLVETSIKYQSHEKHFVYDLVSNLCSHHTQFELDHFMRKYNCQLDLSDVTVSVTLKVSQGHQNWEKKVSSVEVIMQSFKDLLIK